MMCFLKQTRGGSSALWLLLAACGWTLMFSTAASGQRSPSAVQARNIMDREREMRRAEQIIGAPKQPLGHLLTPQTLEDFRQLQIVNNKMMAAAMPADAPDYKMIAAATAEIRKRAARLRDVLVLPATDGEKEVAPPKKTEQGAPQATADPLKDQLRRLDKLVMSFVANPVFRAPNTIDSQLSAKARRDLDGILELSQSVKKNADKLSKATP